MIPMTSGDSRAPRLRHLRLLPLACVPFLWGAGCTDALAPAECDDEFDVEYLVDYTMDFTQPGAAYVVRYLDSDGQRHQTTRTSPYWSFSDSFFREGDPFEVTVETKCVELRDCVPSAARRRVVAVIDGVTVGKVEQDFFDRGDGLIVKIDARPHVGGTVTCELVEGAR